MFIFSVLESRNAKLTILPKILKYIGFGSRIISDCFGVYVNNHIVPKESNLVGFGYFHSWINHGQQFVSFLSPNVHTNNIENEWGLIKTYFKTMHIKTNYDIGLSLYYFHRYFSMEKKKEVLNKILNFII